MKKRYLAMLLIAILLLNGCQLSLSPTEPDGAQPPAQGDPTDTHTGQDQNLIPENPAFSAQYIRTDSADAQMGQPGVTVIRSAAALADYCSAYEESEMATLANQYTDTDFSTHTLVLILLYESSGSIRHNVTGVTAASASEITVSIDRLIPEVGTDDIAHWHIVVDISAVIDENANVSVNLVNKNN
jgi:PBP1b-binding outer membrane lipoprotein LpoB